MNDLYGDDLDGAMYAEKLGAARELAREMATEGGPVTEAELEELRKVWPPEVKHPQNPNAQMLTRLWVKALDGHPEDATATALAQREYFRCLGTAVLWQQLLHLYAVQQLLIVKNGS